MLKSDIEEVTVVSPGGLFKKLGVKLTRFEQGFVMELGAGLPKYKKPLRTITFDTAMGEQFIKAIKESIKVKEFPNIRSLFYFYNIIGSQERRRYCNSSSS